MTTNPMRKYLHLHRVLQLGIKPHANEILHILADGDVAVVVYNLAPRCVPHAKALGWDGKSPVFRMAANRRKLFARNLGKQGDWVSERWFSGPKRGRIFLLVERGTLLINWQPDGFSLEPGSTDYEQSRQAKNDNAAG